MGSERSTVDIGLPEGEEAEAEAASTSLAPDVEEFVSCLWGEARTSGPDGARDCVLFILKREALGLALDVGASGDVRDEDAVSSVAEFAQYEPLAAGPMTCAAIPEYSSMLFKSSLRISSSSRSSASMPSSWGPATS